MVESRWAMTKEVRPFRSRLRALDDDFRAGVYVGGGLVEDEDAGVGEDGAGEGVSLALL